MNIRLKPIDQQVVVITGASSGIGLATARHAGKRGAKVVLFSRDEADLRAAAEGIQADGGEATVVVGDVADRTAMERLARTAMETHGRIDSWINNAGISIYGEIERVSVEDARRLFETNYWGVVHGSLAALPHLKKHGGALVNVGSVLSDTAMPLQGHYSASKHAVKGFTDALRVELAAEEAPVAVTLIQPAAIDTPYPEHAKNYMDVEPTNPPPLYDPKVVARAIVHCCEHEERDVKVGGASKMFTWLETFAPSVGDKYKKAMLMDQQRSDRPARDDDTLHAPRAGDSAERSRLSEHTALKHSAFTAARVNPAATLVTVGLLGVGAAVALRARKGGRRRRRREWALR